MLEAPSLTDQARFAKEKASFRTALFLSSLTKIERQGQPCLSSCLPLLIEPTLQQATNSQLWRVQSGDLSWWDP